MMRSIGTPRREPEAASYRIIKNNLNNPFKHAQPRLGRVFPANERPA
jgi:hypothetical protein